LGDERRAVHDVVAEVNRVMGREVNWQVDLLGWEDTLPAARRPQAAINEAVDAAGLFVGLLWRRWGQPTPVFSSGFEEEFERSRQRHDNTGDPEIWLFFKAVDRDQVADAGDQLKRVLQFRSTREERKDLFYKDFGSVDEFKSQFRESLYSYVLKLSRQRLSAEQGAAEVTPPRDAAAEILTVDAVTADGAPKSELRDALAHAMQRLEQHPAGARLAAYPAERLARLYLYVASDISESHTAELLTSHSQNHLYRVGRGFNLVAHEEALLFRGLLADDSDTIPGWA